MERKTRCALVNPSSNQGLDPKGTIFHALATSDQLGMGFIHMKINT